MYENMGQPEIPESLRGSMRAIIDVMKTFDDDGYVFVSLRSIAKISGISVGQLVYVGIIFTQLELCYVCALKHHGRGQAIHFLVLEKNSALVGAKIVAERLVFDE